MKRLLALAFPLLVLIACRDWTVSRESLLAEAGNEPGSPQCSSCHDYPLHDAHHGFHVHFKAYYITAGRTQTTCRDCHVHSIQGDTILVQDTTYLDTATNQSRSSWLDPDRPAGLGEKVSFVRILSYLRALPTGREPTPLRLPLFREARTGPAHLNGVVDVAFDGWIGTAAAYNPESQTCSSINCHADLRDYRWAAPSKGLGPLRGSYPEEP